MKHLFLVTITLHCLLFTVYCNGQPCLPSGIWFQLQEEIDSFQVNYPNCTEIEGTVLISGPYINNLNGLSVLESIGGSLLIGHDKYGGCSNLEDIIGLHNLSSIGGDLHIQKNTYLNNISALNRLSFIGGDILIQDNYSLFDLSGLDGLTIVQEDISIRNNDALTSLNGLQNIILIEQNIDVRDNDGISSLFGLNNLVSIGQSLDIYYNSSLTSLNGLENLRSISGDLSLYSNNDISSIDALHGLDTIGGSLSICNLDSLKYLSGLDSLRFIGGSLGIVSNFSLIDLSGLNNLNYIGSGLNITGNPFLYSIYDLHNLSFIGEGLSIKYNEVLQSLNGLEKFSSINGNLTIEGNNSLDNVHGLKNLELIDGWLRINGNNSLHDIDALSSLKVVGGYIQIQFNEVLENITGLKDLTSIKGISIWQNTSLDNLDGLQNITSIGDLLNISENYSLTSIAELQNLSLFWEGRLIVDGNPNLNSLVGLDNIPGSSIYDIKITNNSSLSFCEVKSVCDFLKASFSWAEIHNNAPGCNSPEEVKDSCENIYCLPDGITFTTQNQIDSFPMKFPQCLEIVGDVTIYGSDIVNLNGLISLHAIGGHLEIIGTNITSLNGLQSINSIGDYLEIYNNDKLESLMGIENIDPNSITELLIYYNDNLSECALNNVCIYLSNSLGDAEIKDNASGCANRSEVEHECDTLLLEENNDLELIELYPNPCSGYLSIRCKINEKGPRTIELFSITGNKIMEIDLEQDVTGVYNVNINHLSSGLYIIKIWSSNKYAIQKLLISN